MGSGVLRVSRGDSRAKAPPLAERPCVWEFIYTCGYKTLTHLLTLHSQTLAWAKKKGTCSQKQDKEKFRVSGLIVELHERDHEFWTVPDFIWTELEKNAPLVPSLVAEKTGEWKILVNLVQNQSIGSIVGARHTATPRNGRRVHVGEIMTIWWWTSPLLKVEIHSPHQVTMGTTSHVPLQRRAIIITIFRGYGTNCMVPSDWDSWLDTELYLWFQFQIYLRWGWVFLERTQILSGIHFTTHFIDFFVVETKRFVSSSVAMRTCFLMFKLRFIPSNIRKYPKSAPT